jgi:nicotinamidase-related amidase
MHGRGLSPPLAGRTAPAKGPHAMTTALIIIDLQNDYFPGGAMELEGALEASSKARMVLDRFREQGLPVFHIQHVSARPGATFLIPGTEGVEIHALVKPPASETVLQKHYPNSFRDTGLLDLLKDRGISELVIAGMMTHMCVDATCRAAFDHGFGCTVVGDACATRALTFGGVTVPAAQVHAAFLAALHGVYATVLSAKDVIGSIP